MDVPNDDEKRVIIEPLPEKPKKQPKKPRKKKAGKVAVAVQEDVGNADDVDEEEMKKRMTRKKPGRKKMKPEDRKNAPKTSEKHIMTDARREALAKARKALKLKREEAKKARAQSAKEQQETSGMIEQKESKVQMESESTGTVVKPEENDLHVRLGSLEKNMGNILDLLQSGVFSGGAQQARQTTPAPPTELRQPDLTKPEESFVRMNNGGQSRKEMRRVREGYEPPVANIHPNENGCAWSKEADITRFTLKMQFTETKIFFCFTADYRSSIGT